MDIFFLNNFFKKYFLKNNLSNKAVQEVFLIFLKKFNEEIFFICAC